VALFRELAYSPRRIREATPFAMQPVLFNAILVQANRDAAEIARAVGADPEPFLAWANRTADGLDSRLWDEERAIYVDRDVRMDELVATATGAGFAPLYARVPTAARARRLIARLAEFGSTVGGGWALTSLARDDPRFDGKLYWRGPIWPILNWILYRGLARYGDRKRATSVRRALLELARTGGFWEHYDPTTGRGNGGHQFAWTAALVLDVLLEERTRRVPPAPADRR
jgi:glycogen debranching enzyme